MVVLLFGSGKLVITGGPKPEDAANAVDQIVKELKPKPSIRYSVPAAR